MTVSMGILAIQVDISDDDVLRASGATSKGELGKRLTVRKLAALVHRSPK